MGWDCGPGYQECMDKRIVYLYARLRYIKVQSMRDSHSTTMNAQSIEPISLHFSLKGTQWRHFLASLNCQAVNSGLDIARAANAMYTAWLRQQSVIHILVSLTVWLFNIAMENPL